MRNSIATAWRLPDRTLLGADQLSAVVRATPAALLCGVVNAAIITLSCWHPYPESRWSLGFSLRPQSRSSSTVDPAHALLRKSTSLSPRAMRRAVIAALIMALPWSVVSPAVPRTPAPCERTSAHHGPCRHVLRRQCAAGTRLSSCHRVHGEHPWAVCLHLLGA